jgi:hypothetical protein
MGACVPTKHSRDSKLPYSFQTTKCSSFLLTAPPLLTRKGVITFNASIPSMRTKAEILEYLCSLKMNALLRSGEQISKLLSQLVLKNNVQKETICELASLFFEKINQEEQELKNYSKPKIIKKIFEEYYLNLFRQFSNVIKGEVKTLFFLIDYNFSYKMLCKTVEIWQIILSYKEIVNKKKRRLEKINYWWMKTEKEEGGNSNFSIIDTFVYLQQKFISLAKEISLHYTSILAELVESRGVQNCLESK